MIQALTNTSVISDIDKSGIIIQPLAKTNPGIVYTFPNFTAPQASIGSKAVNEPVLNLTNGNGNGVIPEILKTVKNAISGILSPTFISTPAGEKQKINMPVIIAVATFLLFKLIRR